MNDNFNKDDKHRGLPCPACASAILETRKLADINIDFCPDCEGTWYDSGELKAILGKGFSSEKLFNSSRRKESIRKCPVCSVSFTELIFQTGKFSISIDYCEHCHGFWLDRGELHQLETTLTYLNSKKEKPTFFKPQTILISKDSKIESETNKIPQKNNKNITLINKTKNLLREDLIKSYRKRSINKELIQNQYTETLNALKNADESQRNDAEWQNQWIAPLKKTISSTYPGLKHYKELDWELGNATSSITLGLYLFAILFQLPLEVYNPRKSFPWPVAGIITIGLITFLYQKSIVDIQTMPTLVEMENYLEFIGQWALKPSDILSFTLSKMHTLFSYAFLHATWPHILGNYYMLWLFGDNVYDIFQDHGTKKGTREFLMFYFFLSMVSGLTHCLVVAGNVAVSSLPLVGASGAVSGIIASYVRLFPKARLCQIIMFFPLNIPIKAYIFIWFLWNALMGFLYGTYSNVSWSAHLGGFVAGYIFLGRFLPYKIEKLTEET